MAVVFFAMALSSCNKDRAGGMYSVRVIYSESGLGDGSYVDGIYRGVCVAEKEHGNLEMENYCPGSKEYAEAAIAEWMRSVTSDYTSRMLVLADADYADILTKHPEWKIPKGDCVLLLDCQRSDLSRLPAEVLTRKICSYGASYMTGLAARTLGCSKAAVVSANPVHESVKEFCQGFAEGWKYGQGTFDENRDIHYLGAGPSDGFDRADSLYKLSYELDRDYDFVFPVCGGSIQGLYRYTREYPSSFYTCGMDADMQAYSDHVLWSVVKRMDLLVEDIIDEWMTGEPLASEEIYGLRTRYISLQYAAVLDKLFPDYTTTAADEAFRLSLEAEDRYLGR